MQPSHEAPVKLSAIAPLGLLLAVAAGAQPLPVGSGLIAFEEKLKIGPGCEEFSGAGMLVLSVFPDASFRAQSDAGTFSGRLWPEDPRGRTWNLRFDTGSLSFYKRYLEAGARVLCGTDVSISGGGVESFVLKLRRRGSQASLVLRTTATGSAAFAGGRGRHQIKGKGSFVPGLLPASEASGNGHPPQGRIRLIRPD
jgi:hypothetical protein